MKDRVHNCKTLEDLWKRVHEINRTKFYGNDLMPILGGGETFRPKIMFVFINPTHANSSSDKNWKGPRFPFIGTRAVWRVFHKAGMFDDRLMRIIEDSKSWSVDFTHEVLDFLKSRSYYITNIVKWTGHDATLPDHEKISLFLPILEKEIELVKPEYVITFGLIPFENITDQKIKLAEYHHEVMQTNRLKFFEKQFGTHKTKVIPCYFPVGRGNPKGAIDILGVINKI